MLEDTHDLGSWIQDLESDFQDIGPRSGSDLQDLGFKILEI